MDQVSKNILLSKTFWMNVVGVPLFAYLAKKGLPLDDDTQNMVIILVISGVNILMRYASNGPVHLVAPPPAVGALLFAMLLMGSLTACAITNQPPLVQLSTVCDGLGSAYFTAAAYRAQHKLTAGQIQALVDLEPIALESCNKDKPPTDIATAIQKVADAQAKVALINAGVK